VNESSFARYVRYKRPGSSVSKGAESGNPSDTCEPTPEDCLSLPLNCACSEMTVKLVFGYTSTSLPSNKGGKESQPPATLVEFYGEQEDQEDQQAASIAYQSKVEEFQKSGAKLIRVGKSIHVLSKPALSKTNTNSKAPDSPGVAVLLPFYLEKNPVS